MKIQLKSTLSLAVAIATLTLSGCATISDAGKGLSNSIKKVTSSSEAEPGYFYAYNELSVRNLNGIAGEKARSTCGAGLFERCKNYASPAIIKDGQVLAATESSSKSIVYTAKTGSTIYATTIGFNTLDDYYHKTDSKGLSIVLKVTARPSQFEFERSGRIKSVDIAGDIDFTVYSGDATQTKPFANSAYFYAVYDYIKNPGRNYGDRYVANHEPDTKQLLRRESGSFSNPLEAKLTTLATSSDYYKKMGAFGEPTKEMKDGNAPGFYVSLKVGDLVKVTNGPWLKLVENGLKVCSTKAVCS
jgi:predicted small secreted protein